MEIFSKKTHFVLDVVDTSRKLRLREWIVGGGFAAEVKRQNMMNHVEEDRTEMDGNHLHGCEDDVGEGEEEELLRKDGDFDDNLKSGEYEKS